MRVSRFLRLALTVLSFSACAGVVRHAAATPPWWPILDGSGVSPSGGDLSVTVSARTEHSESGHGTSGYLALAVPLDRLAAPRKLTASVDAPAEPSADPRVPVAEPPTERTKDERGVEPALSAALFARLARDTVAAALRAHDVALRRSELEGLASRARWSATLPELRFRVLRSNDESLRLSPTLEDPERYTHDGGNDFLFEASATFKLNRLVFADEELSVERLELERERATERLSEHVLERLFDWHRALSGLVSGESESKRRGLLELERLECEIELDVLTGGWFAEVAQKFAAKRHEPDATTSPPRAPARTSTEPTPAP